MSLDWQFQRRLGNRPHNLMPFLAISLLLHGIVFLGLAIYWHRSVNHPLRIEPDSLLPVKFIDLPPDKVAQKPPPDAKHFASNNSRAGGKAGRQLPSATGGIAARPTTPQASSQPSLTHSRSSIPHPIQSDKPLQQPQPAPLVVPLPPVGSRPKNSPPPVASTEPEPQPSDQQPSPPPSPVVVRPEPAPKPDRLAVDSRPKNSPPPVAPTEPEPQPSDQQPSPPPSPVVVRPEQVPKPAPLALDSHPKPSPPPVAPTEPKPQPISSPPSRQQATPGVSRTKHPPTTDRLAFGSRPNSSLPAAPTESKPKSSSRQSSSQGAASLLGGPVTLADRDLPGDRGDNPPNANRLALDSPGADARQDDVLGPYLEALKRRVERQWRHENPNSSTETIVVFSINRTGQVTDLSMRRGSGSSRVDQAAVNAIQRAAPFAPLPAGYRPLQLNIEFTFSIFDINISPSGY